MPFNSPVASTQLTVVRLQSHCPATKHRPAKLLRRNWSGIENPMAKNQSSRVNKIGFRFSPCWWPHSRNIHIRIGENGMTVRFKATSGSRQSRSSNHHRHRWTNTLWIMAAAGGGVCGQTVFGPPPDLEPSDNLPFPVYCAIPNPKRTGK